MQWHNLSRLNAMKWLYRTITRKRGNVCLSYTRHRQTPNSNKQYIPRITYITTYFIGHQASIGIYNCIILEYKILANFV